MVTWKEYFEFAGILLGLYVVFRTIIWVENRYYEHWMRPPPIPANLPSQPIDASVLSERLKDVRKDFAAEAQKHPASTKRALLVAERRGEIAKKDYFQKPMPEPEPPQEDQGFVLLAL